MAGDAKKAPPSSKKLDLIATDLYKQSNPVRMEVFSQLLEGLRTGGVGAQIPIVQSAVEQSRSATSRAMRDTEASLARSGLAGTPFGEQVLAAARTEGEAATGAIPSSLVREFLSQAPGLITGTGNQVVGGLGSAAQSQASVQQARIAAFSQMVSAAFEAAGNYAKVACWIADRLYGEESIEAFYARYFVNGPMLHRWWGSPLRTLYIKVGQYVARHPRLCEFLRPVFDRAVALGKKELAWLEKS